jgi:hypothetical protein
MAELALNLVALVAAGVVALWSLVALQFVGYDALTRLAWHRRGVFLASSFVGCLGRAFGSAVAWLAAPALATGLVHYFAPSALPWAAGRWGFWTGVCLAVVLTLLLLLGMTREERRADFYRDNRGRLKTRLVLRQQSYLKPYREAWEAAEKKAAEEKPKAAAPGAAPDELPPRLEFEILDVDRAQQLSDDAPYTSDGGDWTVCTCRLVSGSKAAFYFAERSGEPGQDAPFAWGEARLWVPAAADGADLAEAIGDAFRVSKGRARAKGSLPAPPIRFGTAVLSRATSPRPDGSFAGSGSWTATKWFYEEAIELYVNWSLEEKLGRFGEKDESYRDDVYAAFRTLVV